MKNIDDYAIETTASGTVLVAITYTYNGDIQLMTHDTTLDNDLKVVYKNIREESL